jgi:glycerol uptake facilitator-like aquaporin
MMNQYIVEFIGVIVLLYSHLTSDANPYIMGVVTFAVFFMAQGISKAFFTPLGGLSVYLLDKITLEEFVYSTIAQVMAAIAVVLTVSPSKIHV